MVQFNLLPDVKLEFIKARRMKRLVILGSILAGGAAIAVFLIMIISVDVVQKHDLSNLNSDVAKYSKQLKNVKDLDKILTVQNQLRTLPDLHDKKVVTSRTFTYVSQLTPPQVSISELDVDFTQNTITVSGDAPALEAVNSFVDGIKATTYKTDADGSTATKAFSSVVLSSFSRDQDKASFTITFSFDPVIYSSANNVTLTVPNGTNSPSNLLFQKGS